MARPVVKREGIERAAMELFVAKGIAGTTTREIAERAGAAEGTMYRHFKTKEDLAWEIYFSQLTSFMESLRATAAARPDVRSKLSGIVSEFFRLYDADPVLYSYLVLAEHSLLWRLPKDFQTPPALLVEILVEGQGAGEVVKEDPNLLSALIMGTVARLTIFRVYGRVTGELSARSEAVSRLCWRAICKTSAGNESTDRNGGAG